MSDSPEVLDAAPTEPPAASTEIVQVATVEPPEAALWRHFRKVGISLATSHFVPTPFQNKPDEIMACLAYGHELGLGPMQSLQSLDVIQGKPTLKPEMMRSLIRAAGHSLVRVEATSERVTFRGKRADTGDEETVTFTIEDAAAMGLLGKDNWKKMPRAMLTARCTAEIARSLFSDVLMGASYTSEEMGDRHDGDTEEAFEDFPERREPPLQIVTTGSRGAGHVVRQAKGWNWHWGAHDDTGQKLAICNQCGHLCDEHSEIRKGCTRCACKITEWTPLEESAGPASPVSLPGEAEPAGAPEAVASAPVNDDDQTAYAHAEGSALAPTSPPADALPVVGGEEGAEPGGPDPTRVASGPASTRSPLTIEERQRRAIFATCKELAIGDDARHALIALVTGERTSSASDLFRDEGSKVLAVLGKIKTDDCRMEEREGEWVLVAYSEIGVKFLEATATAMVPRADRSGAWPRATEPVDDDYSDAF